MPSQLPVLQLKSTKKLLVSYSLNDIYLENKAFCLTFSLQAIKKEVSQKHWKNVLQPRGRPQKLCPSRIFKFLGKLLHRKKSTTNRDFRNSCLTNCPILASKKGVTKNLKTNLLPPHENMEKNTRTQIVNCPRNTQVETNAEKRIWDLRFSKVALGGD